MAEEKVKYREFDLKIIHFKGDQTLDELHRPCEKCLFMYSDHENKQIMCRIFLKPTRECQRECISDYRLDVDTLVEAMWRKLNDDNKAWVDWINSYSTYMKDDDGKLYVIEKPDDMVQVAKDLEVMCGE
jgi:hypothetical protein